MIAQSWVEEDAGLLLGLLGHVDGHVQVLDPLPHLHLGAGTTKNRQYGKIKHLGSVFGASRGLIRILLCPSSPGSHDDGPLSRVDGEAVGDGPLVFTLLHLQTTEREIQTSSAGYQLGHLA